MKPLNEKSLRLAIDKCCEEPNYRVIVATETRQEGVSWSDIASSYIISNKKEMLQNLNRTATCGGWILFKNDSSIKFISASPYARGYAANLVLFGRNISDEIAACVLEHIEKIRR